MKKLIAFVMSLAVVFTMVGCGSDDNKSSSVKSDSASKKPATVSTPSVEEAFKAPTEYYSIVQITVNPKVNLYLDVNTVVLAVEYVNEDAKATYKNIEKEIVGAKLESGVKTLINKAASAGYFEKEKKVTVDVVESKYEESNIPLLSVLGSNAKQALKDNKVDATLEVLNLGSTLNDATYKEVTTTEEERKAEEEKKKAEAEAAQKLADAKNPKKSLKIGTRYICAEKSTMPEAEYLFTMITFSSNGEYGYGMGDYSTNNLYDDTSPIVYKGKKYYSCSGLGGGGNFKITDTNITLTENKVVFVLNEKSELVIQSDSGDSVLKVGKVFVPEKG